MSDADLTRPQHPPSVPLAEVARWVGAAPPTAEGVTVHGLTLSSQRVRPGDLYVAARGARAHGAAYAGEAAAAGAVAVLTDAEGAGMVSGLPVLLVERPRALVGRLAARLYDEPAQALTLLAVTGTQGKTTTTRLAEAALAATGTRAAVVGTVGTRIGGRDVKTALTTPEAPDLQALFAVMREQAVRVCAMEVSSHALVMGRVDGVVFDVAAFTNLGRDHLDFHRDLDDYFAAKASLFTPERSRRGLTNIDDEHGRLLLDRAGVPMRTLSTRDQGADWSARDISLDAAGGAFVVHGPDGLEAPARVPLAGDFNVVNALCALALAGEAGLDVTAMAAAMGASGGVPGRLERIGDGPVAVFVDYAHKPDAVAAALNALRPVTRGRLIVVIGAGGDRDRGKRPLMGEIASRLADLVIVTDDNPRTEEPAAIRAAVIAGARGPATTEEVGDRRAAIARALSLAEPGDTVLVAGKGHETGQEVAGVVYPFDDRLVVAEILRGQP